VELKPLRKLNREFIIDMMSEHQNKPPDPEPADIPDTIYTADINDISNYPGSIEYTDNTDNIEPMDFNWIFEMEPEINKPGEKKNRRPQKDKKKRNIFSFISDILFYLAIVTVVLAILTSGAKDGAPRMFLGYSYFNVVSPSMQDELPVGSFILVKKIAPQDLKIGDNITFMKDSHTSVTHKINDIYENYNESGALGFQTKGVNNAEPDKDVVYESNIVGKVIFNVPRAGAVISYLRSNIYIIFIIFGIFIAVSFLLRWLFTQTEKNGKIGENKKRNSEKNLTV